MAKEHKESKLSEGEKWRYKGGGSSFVLVQKIEWRKKVAHVTIGDVMTKNGLVDIAHIPIDLKILQKSLIKLAEEQGLKSNDERFMAGYNAWRENQGGVWSIPVVNIVKITCDVVNS
jgi:hypothetical protein